MRRFKPLFSFPFHPLAAAYAPIFFIAVTNPGENVPGDLNRILAVAAGILALAWTAGILLNRRDPQAAALWTSSAMLLFHGYGHFYQLLRNAPVPLGKHSLVITLCLGIILAVTVYLKREKHFRQDFTYQANLLAALWMFALVFLAQPVETGRAPTAPVFSPVPDAMKPNIYHILLDGYSRGDVLKDTYGYDNALFVKKLTALGFYVAEKSQSNYSTTQSSLASMLNMRYLHDQSTVQTLSESILHNEAMRFLKHAGYRIVTFESGCSLTRLNALSDDFLSEKPALNNTEILLIQTTALRILTETDLLKIGRVSKKPGFEFLYEEYRKRIRYILKHLPRSAGKKQPVYVFAHLLSPHRPFVFGRQGEPVTPKRPAPDIFPPDNNPEFVASDKKQYADQVAFLDQEIPATLERIFLEDPGPKIIILHSDHGGDFLNPSDRVKILNAFYFYDSHYESLYPGISPVNTFRILLDQYFGQKNGVLEDRSYGCGKNGKYPKVQKAFRSQL